jgi:hypothetical protein
MLAKKERRKAKEREERRGDDNNIMDFVLTTIQDENARKNWSKVSR